MQRYSTWFNNESFYDEPMPPFHYRRPVMIPPSSMYYHYPTYPDSSPNTYYHPFTGYPVTPPFFVGGDPFRNLPQFHHPYLGTPTPTPSHTLITGVSGHEYPTPNPVVCLRQRGNTIYRVVKRPRLRRKSCLQKRKNNRGGHVMQINEGQGKYTGCGPRSNITQYDKYCEEISSVRNQYSLNSGEEKVDDDDTDDEEEEEYEEEYEEEEYEEEVETPYAYVDSQGQMHKLPVPNN